ncbi:hypothetical protein SLNWT_6498 [Streptomyces albus]|uniref:Uncharacterized protein n=1 Tax=Streptomyces albus (strain ATCC 21838 / DSM 41398 / FERM P-419 / JCM 4703 / NBRC 107858) TaxID=1081613 RepID=A0A0B5EYN5_STRA4|nr:hypothetical protein SLNWT_6498 [Streptomyces albus]AOU81178.1 hypothetical protein SLNHY_6487 [Streptomyces albus]AYN36876.1 hypothetical protein DUI70_6382 [Streptomyces albus]
MPPDDYPSASCVEPLCCGRELTRCAEQPSVGRTDNHRTCGAAVGRRARQAWIGGWKHEGAHPRR